MERDQINVTMPLLIPFNGSELPDLYDALVAHSELLDKEGDHLGAAKMMLIVSRVSRLQGIELEISRQSLLALGLGVAKGRPQG